MQLSAVIGHELTLVRRDGRLMLTMVLLLAIVAAAVVAGWRDYAVGEAERRLFSEAAYQQWVDQAPKHPHRAASFGMFVSKPENALAILETGLRPYAGRTLRLEAHSQAAFAYAPVNDAPRSANGIGERSGAGLLLLCAGLMALILGALAITRERETGVLRLLLAQGASPGQWLAGKYLALLLPITGIVLIVAAVMLVPIISGGGTWDDGLRLAMLSATLALYIAIMVGVGIAVSAKAGSSRAAFAIVLSFWVATTLIAPRVAAHAALTLAPAPDAEAYEAAIGADFMAGYDGKPGWDAQLTALEQRTLARYNVATLDELPIGFSGLRMIAMESWSNEVAARHFARLQAIYARQDDIRMTVAIVAPFLAGRALSQNAAGMDWAHYRHFAASAETYRQGFNRQMNELIVTGTRGQAWEMDATRQDFARTPRFAYAPPSMAWAIQHAWVPLAILLGWAFAMALILAAIARRLKP